MLQDEKILITGPAGQIAFPLAAYLAADNEVWGLARFSDSGARERVEAIGVTAHQADLAAGDFGELPDDFTYVLHLAVFQGAGSDYDHALRVNVEGTGLLLQHCRKAKAALVTSTQSVYKPSSDPWHAFTEADALGDSNQPFSPTYAVSKIAEEGVARFVARAFSLPVTVARINVSYGPNGGLPAYHLDWMMAGQAIPMRAPGPTPYSPIHQDDMNAQVEPLLAAASVPATIVNWAGDEVVTAEEWCAHLAGLAGVEPVYDYREYQGSIRGGMADITRRRALTGPCEVTWREGMRHMYEARYPTGPYPTGEAAETTAGADRLRAALDDRGS